MLPPSTVTPERAALWLYCTTWSKAAPHAADANGRASTPSHDAQSDVAFSCACSASSAS
jgi:hypothetical protein